MLSARELTSAVAGILDKRGVDYDYTEWGVHNWPVMRMHADGADPDGIADAIEKDIKRREWLGEK